MKAAHFGSLGPNIFDYIPARRRRGAYGNPVSFFLHDGGTPDLLKGMLALIYGRKDRNTEWASLQRAYLYGYISHMVSDAVFHPFIMYWSGFPSEGDVGGYARFREQNLLFTYNLDNYYQYYCDNRIGMDFDIAEFFPLERGPRFSTLCASVKTLILESLREVYPDIYQRIIFYPRHGREKNVLDTFGILDVVPRVITFSYWLKRTYSRRMTDLITALKRLNLPYNDYLVRYPAPRKLNRHVLNFHQDRWQYPAGKPGFIYHSVDHLLQEACERTVDCWEMLEEGMYSDAIPRIHDILCVNGYTGENRFYREMIYSNPVRLHF